MKIENKDQYQSALKRLDVVFMSDQSTPEGKEAAILVDAIEAYEDIHHPIGLPKIDLTLIVDPEDNTRVVNGGIADVPMLESIISRAGNTLKLRFQDGSVGEITVFDESSVTVTDGVLTINGREMPPATLWLNTKFI